MKLTNDQGALHQTPEFQDVVAKCAGRRRCRQLNRLLRRDDGGR